MDGGEVKEDKSPFDAGILNIERFVDFFC